MPLSTPGNRTPLPAFASADEFVASVLALRPALAVFDCDGTLWSQDSGEAFMRWTIDKGILSQERTAWILNRYQQYRNREVGEEQMCGEMVTIYHQTPLVELESAARDFFDERIAPGIFPEMLALVQKLIAAGCEIWAVSSTNDWVVRAGTARFGIAPERVLAACIHIEDGLATDRLIQVPSGPNKAVAVRKYIQRTPDVAFGNSIHDLQLLECAKKQFAINPNPDLEATARERGWSVYLPLK
ncbi:MAG: HAD family hydrolase [Candidatus Korobacteraceae bacterium]